ncbi:histidine phosphatase family protein [Aquabacter sp. L1I39]|uniref:histidine phosphatase family protein n=1 Tax=Aquabacter sp. L1I39 TaxID=2820278 RepID=UPI001ADB4EEB|nr:histidine phosphatase family protein [Aquabacter sp. L1I39]QTL02459.1 histidine phosphatase family protein [Aquabacter sp. L1I39]
MLRFGLAFLAFLSASVFPLLAAAAPARVILLRHAEKRDDFRLCETGLERARALADQYLGAQAREPLLAPGQAPGAVFAVTLHALETAVPTTTSWKQPVVLYAVIPEEIQGFKDWRAGFPDAIAERSRWVTRLLLDDPHWTGRTVFVVWEHRGIANAALEAAHPGQQMTLRQTLGLDRLPNVPHTWPDSTYNYFWIIDFAPDGTPVNFQMKKQVFTGAYANLPANDWDMPDGLDPLVTGCKR